MYLGYLHKLEIPLLLKDKNVEYHLKREKYFCFDIIVPKDILYGNFLSPLE
jgi:hypothetical protein